MTESPELLPNGTKALMIDLIEIQHVDEILWHFISDLIAETRRVDLGEGGYTMIKVADMICAMTDLGKLDPST